VSFIIAYFIRIRQHTSAYVSINYVSIRQFIIAHVSDIRPRWLELRGIRPEALLQARGITRGIRPEALLQARGMTRAIRPEACPEALGSDIRPRRRLMSPKNEK
jgi:hypothetical protein